MASYQKAKITLAIPDLHAPFMHRDAAPFLSAVCDKYSPDRTVFLGDVVDLHSLSRFVRDPAGMSCGDELRAARKQLQPIYGTFPEALVCWGNHDTRLVDRALEAGIPGEAIQTLGDVIQCPSGWEWSDEWELDGVLFQHGQNWSGADAHKKAARENVQNTVIGHIHAHAGIHYFGNRLHMFWGFNAGCLIDRKKYAFAYAKRNPARPIIGVGVIDGDVPSFVPMKLKRGGRWTGKLS